MKGFAARLLWSALTLLGASLLVFSLARAVPADPVAVYAGPQADAETRARIRKEMGLDDPFWQQYLRYLSHAAKGDLGKSIVTSEVVSEAISTRFPTTLALSVGGVFVWLVVGIPLGLLTALNRGRRVDRWALVVSMIGISLPVFWLGRMLQYELAYRRGLLPVAGLQSWQHLILPSLTLGLVGAGYYARLVHSSVSDALNQDFVRTARAKGAGLQRVLLRHALPNALLPLLTVLGADIAGLLGGVVFTESVFALPGMGALAVQSVLNLDVPMIMGTVLFAALMVVAANLIVDLLYRVIDPRIRA